MTPKSLRAISCLALCAVAAVASGQGNRRPAFDKHAYLKTAWSAANPWWLPNKSPTHGSGGPDFAWRRYSDDRVTMWRQVAERCRGYGLTGLQMEMMVRKAGYIEVLQNVLQGFRQAGNGMMVMPFLTGGATDLEQARKQYLALFDRLAPILKQHPNVFRVDGHPVFVLYNPNRLKPKDWETLIPEVEAKHGRMLWLVNASHAKPDWLRAILPVVDGISMYANWSEEGQRALYEGIAPVMHNEFPEKIFEGAVHTTYCVHFHYGGIAPRLTEKYRNSWDITLAAKPDALTITNWFDTYENSRIMPSYELDDSMLRIAKHRLAQWRGQTPNATATPDLYVSNYVSVLLGQPIEVEVLGFPLKRTDRDVRVSVELCTEAGEVVHQFAERTMRLDRMAVERFTIGSETFARHRTLRPRLVHAWADRAQAHTQLLPPTHLVTSLRPHMLFWCRSLKRPLLTAGGADWTLNGVSSGETAAWPKDGIAVLSCGTYSNRSSATQVDRGGGWVRILRNGREIESFSKWDLKMTKAVRLPPPGGALDWINLELANANGGRYLSPCIWVGDGSRPGVVSLPILREDGTVADVSVDAARVPFFFYPCDRDTGGLLIDRSGYEHHGYLGGKGYGGGHLARTGYRHDHTGPVRPGGDKSRPAWGRDEAGRGLLHFDGASYAMIQGGTAFPYAATYECALRPTSLGREQGILGAANGQVSLVLLEDGRVRASRAGAVEGMGGSKPPRRETVSVTSSARVAAGKWSHVAVAYDLRELKLYVDGEPQGSRPVLPMRSHEWINAMVIGGLCKFPYKPVPRFVGDMRSVRFYGRDLEPGEFLRVAQ